MTMVEVIQMLDINRPEHVEVRISADRMRLWVNVDGICRLRIYNIKLLDTREE